MVDENKRRGRNNIIEIYGQTGSTKSYCGMTISSTIDSNFGEYKEDKKTPKKIFFEQSVYTSDMSGFKEGDCTMLDEQITEYGMGKDRIASQMHNFAETIRKKKISLIRCSPIRKGTLELSLSHWVIECPSGFYDENQRIVKCALQTNYGLTLGYLLINHPETKLGSEFIQNYERIKDLFLGKVTGKEGVTSLVDKKAKEVFNSKRFQDFFNSVVKITNDDIYAFVDEAFPELKMNVEHYMISKKLRVLIKRTDPYKLYGVLLPGQKQVDSAGNVLNIGKWPEEEEKELKSFKEELRDLKTKKIRNVSTHPRKKNILSIG